MLGRCNFVTETDKLINDMKSKALFTLLFSWFGVTAVVAQPGRSIYDKDADAAFLLVGCYAKSDDEAVKVYKFDGRTGNTEYVCGAKGIPNPAFLTSSAGGERIYAIGDEDWKLSTANSLHFDKKNGKLALISSQSTGGGLPIYITLSPKEDFVLTANYMGGSITVFALDKDGKLLPDGHLVAFEGSGPNKKRQEQPHLHCVAFTPDGKYILATDLGTDNIYQFPVVKQEKEGMASSLLVESAVDSIKMEAGSGPRHICFHPNGKFAYLVSELSGNITVFSYNAGKLERLQSIVCDPFKVEGSADIHVSSDGKYLYASRRLKSDGIVIYSIEPEKGTLTQVGYQPTGLYPRSFAISPDDSFLAVVCRDSNCIQIFERSKDTGLLKDTGKTIKLDKPAFVKFL